MKVSIQRGVLLTGVLAICQPCLWMEGGARTPADDETSRPPLPDGKAPAQVKVKQEPIHATPIQVDVNLVVVNVTVTDPYDRIVTGLDKSNFQVYDEKVEQQISTFSTEDAPIAVGLIFDSSGSMGEKIQKSKEAAMQFFKTSNPQDEFLLINFSERPNLITGFTSKIENVQDRLLFVKSGGSVAAWPNAAAPISRLYETSSLKPI